MLESIPAELRDCRLDHIAIAVENLEKSMEMYSHLGLSFDEEIEEIAEQKVRVAFARVDFFGKIELLASTDPQGPIAQFISKKGPGLHHLCLRVSDLQKRQAELVAQGFRFLYPEAKLGAHQCLINFLHPQSCGGVLIELSEKRN